MSEFEAIENKKEKTWKLTEKQKVDEIIFQDREINNLIEKIGTIRIKAHEELEHKYGLLNEEIARNFELQQQIREKDFKIFELERKIKNLRENKSEESREYFN